MKRSLSILILLTLMAGVGAAATKSDGAVVWRDLDAALAESQEAAKPVMIHFTAQWCGWCTKMKKEVYGQNDVAAVLNQDFIPEMVDTDRHPDLKAAYGVEGLPTIWFLTSAGEGITYIHPFRDAQGLSFGVCLCDRAVWETLQRAYRVLGRAINQRRSDAVSFAGVDIDSGAREEALGAGHQQNIETGPFSLNAFDRTVRRLIHLRQYFHYCPPL